MKQITVAVDSFKGSLSSFEVATAAEQAIHARLPHCRVQKIAIADGGEGTAQALVSTLNGEWREVRTSDPLMRPIKARYGVINNGKTAIIEMATASGLTLLKDEERNPLLATTYGTGELIADAVRQGARHLLIGIGGSATNDAGMGMLEALGYRFYDSKGNNVAGCGAHLARVAHIDASGALPALKECLIEVACDVTNPLYGATGAAYVYALQKGATPAVVEQLDQGLRIFAEVVNAEAAFVPGAGAAGGMGYALQAVLGARLRAGIDMVLDAIRFDEIVSGSDLVITGEGRIDYQTVMGKAPCGVLKRAKAQGIPVVAIGGSVADCEALRESDFAAILPVVAGPVTLQQAMQREVAEDNVRRTVEQIVRLTTLNLNKDE
jgi:glycerate kinase